MKKLLSDIKAKFLGLNVKERVHLILMLLLSLSIFATAICFIVSCISIFLSGGSTPFSREAVALHFERIAPVTYITVLLLIAAGVTSMLIKEPKVKAIPLAKRTLLKVIEEKLISHRSDTYTSVSEKEKKYRRVITYIVAGSILLFAAVALIFILNPARYSLDDVNTDIAYSMVIALSSTVLSFAACYVASYLLDKSYAKQAEAARAELKAQRSSAKASGEGDDELLALSKNEGHAVTLVRLGVLVLSVTFIILGIFNGGMADVLGKAVRICTECIGLG